MAGFLHNLIENYQDHLERQRNRPFLRATMAACALVASADGEVSFGERVRVDQILATLDKLQVFDPHVGIDLFNEFTDAILENPKQGHEDAWCALEEGAPDTETRKLLIRICLAVCEANGDMPLVDQIEIVSLCNRLGLDAERLGLYVDDPGFPDA